MVRTCKNHLAFGLEPLESLWTRAIREPNVFKSKRTNARAPVSCHELCFICAMRLLLPQGRTGVRLWGLFYATGTLLAPGRYWPGDAGPDGPKLQLERAFRVTVPGQAGLNIPLRVPPLASRWLGRPAGPGPKGPRATGMLPLPRGARPCQRLPLVGLARAGLGPSHRQPAKFD
jgi:hypothetical protein